MSKDNMIALNTKEWDSNVCLICLDDVSSKRDVHCPRCSGVMHSKCILPWGVKQLLLRNKIILGDNYDTEEQVIYHPGEISCPQCRLNFIWTPSFDTSLMDACMICNEPVHDSHTKCIRCLSMLYLCGLCGKPEQFSSNVEGFLKQWQKDAKSFRQLYPDTNDPELWIRLFFQEEGMMEPNGSLDIYERIFTFHMNYVERFLSLPDWSQDVIVFYIPTLLFLQKQLFTIQENWSCLNIHNHSPKFMQSQVRIYNTMTYLQHIFHYLRSVICDFDEICNNIEMMSVKIVPPVIGELTFLS